MKYHIYGLILETDFPFRNRLVAARDDPRVDVRFTIATESVDVQSHSSGRHFESYEKHASGEPVFFIDEHTDRSILTFPHLVRYHVIGNSDIIAEPLGEISEELVEIHVLGLVASFLLERKGVLAIHASAVVRPEGAVAFLASNKGGKTSLAASFVQAGDALLTDDILPVTASVDHVIAAAGYPQMRMWPEHAEVLIGRSDELDRVLPDITKRLIPLDAVGGGGFEATSQALAAIFIPERQEGATAAIVIERMPPGEAFRLVLANGFIAQIAQASGMIRTRFSAIANVIGNTPVFSLRYPSGVDHLPHVRDAILTALRDEVGLPGSTVKRTP